MVYQQWGDSWSKERSTSVGCQWEDPKESAWGQQPVTWPLKVSSQNAHKDTGKDDNLKQHWNETWRLIYFQSLGRIPINYKAGREKCPGSVLLTVTKQSCPPERVGFLISTPLSGPCLRNTRVPGKLCIASAFCVFVRCDSLLKIINEINITDKVSIVSDCIEF